MAVASPKTRLQYTRRLTEQERARRDAHWFIFGSGLKTKDEHDLEQPVKPMPDKLYMRATLDTLLVSGGLLEVKDAIWAERAGFSQEWLEACANSGLCFIEKSRQVMVSWLVCAYLLWRAKYRDHQLILVQSKKEDDAAALVFVKEPHFGRMSFMETHLPKHLQTVLFPRGGSYCRLFFPNSSQIWGIPEGGDIIRSQTPSVVFSDEAAFQPEFGNAYTAALPCIKGGGQFIAASSANPGAFADIVEASR